MTDPVAINTSAAFKHRDAILAALREGGACRPDDRELWANELLGTYLIRLNIALDQKLNGGLPEEENSHAQDLRHLTEALRRAGSTRVRAFHVHAPDGVAYQVFQAGDDGENLGCLRREPQGPLAPNAG
jgi:hypothetical protein